MKKGEGWKNAGKNEKSRTIKVEVNLWRSDDTMEGIFAAEDGRNITGDVAQRQEHPESWKSWFILRLNGTPRFHKNTMTFSSWWLF